MGYLMDFYVEYFNNDKKIILQMYPKYVKEYKNVNVILPKEMRK